MKATELVDILLEAQDQEDPKEAVLRYPQLVPDDFFNAYVEAAFWTEELGDAELSDQARLQMQNDCRRFWIRNKHYIQSNPKQAGHDFWLTRNGHGSGFWDREEIWGDGTKGLTDAAHAFGEQYLELDDATGLVYVL